jgi:riboflavin biosynthesis pyrimidine reductase
MKPEVIMLMASSLDGRLHPSRWTSSPDGDRRQWSALFEKTHDALEGDAWIVGRVTMAEMSRVEAHRPAVAGSPERPLHAAARDAKQYAVAIDPSGRLHFASGILSGDHVIVLLGQDVSDGHLAELATDGVSYIVSDQPQIDLGAMLKTLNREFGIKRLLLEGGGTINGQFLAAGLVDEVNILVGPAFDGDGGVQGIVAYPGGLAGKCELRLMSANAVEHGVAHLRYKVSRARN